MCTKYQEAAKIVNLALEGLVGQCLPGAKILDLCEFGHTVLEAQANKLYTKKVDGKVIDRGVAFPVCISVNDLVCNFSPLAEEETVSYEIGTGVRSVRPSCSGRLPSGPRACWCDVAAFIVLSLHPPSGEGVPRLVHRPSI